MRAQRLLVLLAALTTASVARADGVAHIGGSHPVVTPLTPAVPPVPPVTTTASDFLCQETPQPPKQFGGQIFFRGGGGFLTAASRGREVFTDTAGATGLVNDGRAGYSFGFGFQLPLMKESVFGNTLLGEVLMDMSRFSNNRAVVATSALLGAPRVDTVPVTQMVVAGSPKYRFDSLGNVRPWLIPAGMAMMVNSPPTDKTTYLDLGLQFGAGVDYRLTQSISLGVDCRYFYNLNRPNGSWLITGVYLGFDF